MGDLASKKVNLEVPYIWLRTLESNQASRINSPLPTPCLLLRNKLYLQLCLGVYSAILRGQDLSPVLSLAGTVVSRVLVMYVGAYIALLTAYYRLAPKAKILYLNCQRTCKHCCLLVFSITRYDQRVNCFFNLLSNSKLLVLCCYVFIIVYYLVPVNCFFAFIEHLHVSTSNILLLS
jgi:hypothetical protein